MYRHRFLTLHQNLTNVGNCRSGFIDFVDKTTWYRETSAIIWRKCKRMNQHNSIWRNSRCHVIDLTHFTKYPRYFATIKKVLFYIINWQFEGFLCVFFHHLQFISSLVEIFQRKIWSFLALISVPSGCTSSFKVNL